MHVSQKKNSLAVQYHLVTKSEINAERIFVVPHKGVLRYAGMLYFTEK